MSKPRLLDLFCGAGGASMGYYKAGFEVEGVDIKPQPHYPFKFYQADALGFPLEGYDAYSASPPCQEHSTASGKRRKNPIPYWKKDCLAETRVILEVTDKPFVIENVVSAPMFNYIKLYGTMFGLKVVRERWFELHGFEILLLTPPIRYKAPVQKMGYSTVVGGGCAGTNIKLETWQEAMGIDWMSKQELTQAIPPAYTEYIGKYLVEAVKGNNEYEQENITIQHIS